MTFERRLLIFFLAVILGIVVIGIVAYRTNKVFHANEMMVRHTEEVLYQSEQIVSIIKDFESGSRGYVVTADSNYLANFDIAKDTIFFHIQALKALTRDDALQQKRIDTLTEFTYRRLGFSEESIRIRNEGGFEQARQLLATRGGQSTMNQIVRIISDIQHHENNLLVQRQQASERNMALFNDAFYGLLACVVVLVFIALTVIRLNFGRTKEAEELARAGEKQIQTIFKAAPDAVVVIDEEGRINRWNDKAEILFGWTAIEVIGKLLSETIIPHRFREAHQKGMNNFLKTGEGPVLGTTIEIQALKKTSEEFDVALSISPTKVNGVYLFIGFIRDITEQKRVAEEIKHTNIFLDTILENLPNMIFVKEAKELRFVRFNKAGEDLLGYARADLLGKNDYDFFPKEQADFFTAKDREVLRKKELLNISEEPINTSHGQRWLHTKKIPLTDNNGKPLYLLGISEDITEQKKQEELLLESNERFHKLFYSNPTPMAITTLVAADGKGGVFIDANESFEKLLGYKKEELLGKSSLELGIVDAEGRSKTVEMLRDTSSSRNAERSLTSKSGRKLSVLLSIEQLKIRNLDCILSAVVDISDRKEAEEKITQLNENLAQTVAQVEAINKELESFTYSVSHDLRSPLRIIDGYSDILLNDYKNVLDEEGRKTIVVIITNARRMGQLIDDLLNLSRLGRRELSFNIVDMNQLVKPVIEELLTLAGDQKVEMKIGNLDSAKCDSGVIRQVWTNLISNALKYSGKKEKSVVEIGSYKDGKNIVYFVKDNGVGFDMKYADKLFGIFQRLHRLDEFEGTGVGLAIVQRVIAKHGGKVWAEAELNKGATFYFTLPA